MYLRCSFPCVSQSADNNLGSITDEWKEHRLLKMEVCHDSLWNSTVSWETNSPRLSSCLQSVLEVFACLLSPSDMIAVQHLLIPIKGGRWFSSTSASTALAPHQIISTSRSAGCSTRRTQRDSSHPLSLYHRPSLCRPLPCHLLQSIQPPHQHGAGSHCPALLLQPHLLHPRGIHSTRSESKNIILTF